VEHSVQAQWLSQHGCHFAQGYLFAKPMPEDELSRQLKGVGPVKEIPIAIPIGM